MTRESNQDAQESPPEYNFKLRPEWRDEEQKNKQTETKTRYLFKGPEKRGSGCSSQHSWSVLTCGMRTGEIRKYHILM